MPVLVGSYGRAASRTGGTALSAGGALLWGGGVPRDTQGPPQPPSAGVGTSASPPHGHGDTPPRNIFTGMGSSLQHPSRTLPHSPLVSLQHLPSTPQASLHVFHPALSLQNPPIIPPNSLQCPPQHPSPSSQCPPSAGPVGAHLEEPERGHPAAAALLILAAEQLQALHAAPHLVGLRERPEPSRGSPGWL